MKLNIALIIGSAGFLISGLMLTERCISEKKIAYVRSTELVYGFRGMQEAREQYEQKSRMYQANMDTLQRDYQLAFAKFSSESSGLSVQDRQMREKALMAQQESAMQYARSLESKMKEEDQKMTEGVLNQINSFVEEYGRSKGYEIILGTTISGSILYGDEAIDITDEVLKAINKNYQTPAAP